MQKENKQIEKCWDILTDVANDKGKIRYQELGDKIGDVHARQVGRILEPIQDYCLKNDLPPLTILVINQDGVPGIGFTAWKINNAEEGFRQVYKKNWNEVNNPFSTKPKNWTREETIIAFNLYCKIPFSKAVSGNPNVIETAKIIGRSPSSVAMKLGNFGSFDPELKKRNIGGLTNASKLDKAILDEFNGNWEELTYESENLIANMTHQSIDQVAEIDVTDLPEGSERSTLMKTRINQSLFRKFVLSAYNNTCCITGIRIPQLLIASHIIPWSKDKKNRLNPRNGLSLNALHDKAFDNGLITVTPDFRLKISKATFERYKDEVITNFFRRYENEKIYLPEKFAPEPEFLEYHNKHIFEKF
ncbi:HNH endonuclease [Patescibacteria group bacterium]|nr:HNH endonuclease [Patescibacteria group bacterium]